MPPKRGETRQAVYAFIQQRIAQGEPPSTREIQAALGFKAVQSVQQHLDGLVAEGLLTHEPGKARSYRPAREAGWPTLQVPLLGRVRAGPLTEAIEALEGHVPFTSRRKLAADALFALRIQGDSMMNAAILDGDIVIVRRQPDAQSGDIVVALVGDEATVKRLRRVPNGWLLIAENPAYAPIVPEELRILGKVIEVRRTLEDGMALEG